MKKISIVIGLLLVQTLIANMTIYTPLELKSQFNARGVSNISYSIANFGVIPYGKKMTGTVVVANPMTNCDFEEDIYDQNIEDNQNKFLLILRGDCTFVTKARNAQLQGASLAIIMDNQIERSDKVIMANDGHGSSVTIPSIFISEEDGAAIQKWIQQNPTQHVTMTIKFDTNMTDVVNMMIWLDSNIRASYNFVKKFQTFYQQIKNYLTVKVYFNTFSCNQRACNVNDCFGKYQYCAADPDGSYGAGTGKDIIREQLRQYFISENYFDKWWGYMKLYDQHCADFSNLDECSSIQMKKAGIDAQKINNMVTNSFDKNGDNAILKKAAELKTLSGIIFVPDVLINNVAYLGELDAIDVFELVCNSLNHPPAQCNSFLFDESKIVITPQQSHISKVLIIVTVSLIVFFFLMICIYRRFARRQLSREMNSEVNQLVSQYITLYETKKIENRANTTQMEQMKENV